jgi:hypothetical protein
METRLMEKQPEPLNLYVVEDYPNTCPIDGIYTDVVESYDGHTLERCLKCQTLFKFWDED